MTNKNDDDFIGGMFEAPEPPRIKRGDGVTPVAVFQKPAATSSDLEARERAAKARMFGPFPGQLPIPFIDEAGKCDITEGELEQIHAAGMDEATYRALVEDEPEESK